MEKGIQTHDVETDWLIIEVKTRHDLPQWLLQAVHQVRVNADESKLPIVVLKSPTTFRTLVVMDLSDFKDWFGEVKHA